MNSGTKTHAGPAAGVSGQVPLLDPSKSGCSLSRESYCSAEAQFEYRCRRCGELYRNPCCSPDLARWILIEVAMLGSGGSTKKGGKVYRYTTHGCKDGGEGIADLLGYRIVGMPNIPICVTTDSTITKEAP